MRACAPARCSGAVSSTPRRASGHSSSRSSPTSSPTRTRPPTSVTDRSRWWSAATPCSPWRRRGRSPRTSSALLREIRRTTAPTSSSVRPRGCARDRPALDPAARWRSRPPRADRLHRPGAAVRLSPHDRPRPRPRRTAPHQQGHADHLTRVRPLRSGRATAPRPNDRRRHPGPRVRGRQVAPRRRPRRGGAPRPRGAAAPTCRVRGARDARRHPGRRRLAGSRGPRRRRGRRCAPGRRSSRAASTRRSRRRAPPPAPTAC